MAGRIDASILALSLPLMCYALFFILSVELPDVEADQLGGKKNLLTFKGRRAGIELSIIVTFAATVLFIILASLGTLLPIEMWLFVLFSIVPLAAALYGATMPSEDRRPVISQVKLNFCALMLILVAAVVYLATLA